jgi:hypothetical protein
MFASRSKYDELHDKPVKLDEDAPDSPVLNA